MSLLENEVDREPQIDPNKNYLEELVGEGRKFKDIEALAKGKHLADQMVDFKNRQFDELNEDYLKLRAEYNAGSKLQELIDRLSQQQNSNSENTLNANENTKPVDLKEIESLISNKVQEIETSKRQQDNYNQIKNKLVERYGNNYQSVLKQEMDDLGMSSEEVDRLARNNPKAFIRTFGLDRREQSESFQAPPHSSRNDRFAPSVPKRTWSYYQKMRKESPDLYRNPKTQVQMLEDMKELGSEFEDGDFHI